MKSSFSRLMRLRKSLRLDPGRGMDFICFCPSVASWQRLLVLSSFLKISLDVVWVLSSAASLLLWASSPLLSPPWKWSIRDSLPRVSCSHTLSFFAGRSFLFRCIWCNILFLLFSSRYCCFLPMHTPPPTGMLSYLILIRSATLTQTPTQETR
jgi:hypothetical protein